MDVIEKFWTACEQDAKRGYSEENGSYICLLCGMTAEIGIIFPVDGNLYDARKYMEHHIPAVHGSVFEYLNGLDKGITGLTSHMSSMLGLFYNGRNDMEVQRELGIGSTSTIRSHRFALREKEKQSKVFVIMMALLKEQNKNAIPARVPHRTVTMVGSRYGMSEEEHQKVISNYFPDGPEGKLRTFSMKEKYRLVILGEIVKRFEEGRIYQERELNAILKNLCAEDHAAIRRYLIDYGFLAREAKGRRYWIKENNDEHQKDN